MRPSFPHVCLCTIRLIMPALSTFIAFCIVLKKICRLGREEAGVTQALLQTTMNIASFVTLIIMHFPSRKCLSFLSNGFPNCFWRLVVSKFNHPHLGEWMVVMDMKRKKSCGIRTSIFHHHHHICKQTRISLLIQHKWQSQSVKVVTRVSDNASQSLHYKFHLLPNLIPQIVVGHIEKCTFPDANQVHGISGHF